MLFVEAMLFSHSLRNLLKLHVLNDPVLLDDHLVFGPLVTHVVLRENSVPLENESCRRKLRITLMEGDREG